MDLSYVKESRMLIRYKENIPLKLIHKGGHKLLQEGQYKLKTILSIISYDLKVAIAVLFYRHLLDFVE